MIRSLPLAAALLAAAPAFAQDDAAARITRDVRTLASDTFEGRAPGTPGEDRTIGYLIARFQGLGLEPAGPDGGWVQRVPLLHTRLGTPATLAFSGAKGAVPLTVAKEIYLSTIRPDDRAVVDAPMVFVGYGVDAPERKWNDFKGADLKGKVAVFLVNDPDFETKPGEPAAGRFGDRTMT
jgi:hypothetical protein